MSRQIDRRFSVDPPIEPERVMPIVVNLLWVITLALIALGLATLWPVLSDLIPIPASASPLALSSALFVVFLAAVAWWVVSKREHIGPTRER